MLPTLFSKKSWIILQKDLFFKMIQALILEELICLSAQRVCLHKEVPELSDRVFAWHAEDPGLIPHILS